MLADRLLDHAQQSTTARYKPIDWSGSRFASLVSLGRKAKGTCGEQLVCDWLQQRSRAGTKSSDPAYDLLVDGKIRAEVKLALLNTMSVDNTAVRVGWDFARIIPDQFDVLYGVLVAPTSLSILEIDSDTADEHLRCGSMLRIHVPKTANNAWWTPHIVHKESV